MITYLLLGAALVATLAALVVVVATGLMLVAIRADHEWEQRNYDSKR